MEVTQFYLILSAVIFSLGAFGVLVRRNIIVIFMSVELMLNGVNLSFIALARHFGDVDAHIFVVFVMAVAAAEAAVGLAIVISIFRTFRTVESDDVFLLKG